jgi:3-deoxy-D-manno-octulosonic-acid transferase
VSELTERLSKLIGSRPVVIAGSTTAAVGSGGPNRYGHNDEEDQIIGMWPRLLAHFPDALLIVAPRHPERFDNVEFYMRQIKGMSASELDYVEKREFFSDVKVFCLNTIGDLASVYQLASVAFVGGSLVARGGHNPLEPAQFGVPVVMGPHFENFRTVVHAMKSAGGIRIVADNEGLEAALRELLTDRNAAQAMGERGRNVFEEQQGATLRTTQDLVALIGENEAARQAETPC